MKTANIRINTIEDVKNFVTTVTKCNYDVDIVSGRYAIDAKSIMGIFSLDLSKPLELRVQNQFGAFCVKVLKNEARYIQREYTRLRDREKSLGELTASELEQTATWDKHFMDEHVFEVQGLPVVVTGDLLADALAQLPEDKRDVILLSYFLGMTDREISEKLNVVHQTVSKRRLTTLKELREYLMKEGFEWTDK